MIQLDLKRLTIFQQKLYPCIVKTIQELNEENIEATYSEIEERVEQNLMSIHGVDIQLGLINLTNNRILNINDGIYSINTRNQKEIDILLLQGDE